MFKIFIKRLLKIFISVVYIVFATLNKIFNGIFRNRTPTSLIIVMYHSVHSDQKDKFNKHVQFAKKVGIPVFPEIDQPVHPGERHIAITFDDGFENFYQNALPVLQEHNIPSTVFVPTDFIGVRPGWIKDKSHPNYNENLMSEIQLTGLPPDIVKIGSHCKSHLRLANLNDEDVRMELKESKRVLEKLLDREIRLLALPHGSFPPDIKEISLKAGYDRVFFCVPISRPTNFSNVLEGRIEITLNDWPIEYKLKYLGAYQWERYTFQLKNKLRLVQDYY